MGDRMEEIMNEVIKNFKGMDGNYSFYFTFDDEVKKTVFVKENEIEVVDGKATDEADCVCKISSTLFKKIWYENYKPGMKEIFSGELKTNKPDLLQKFLKACK